MEDGLEAEIGAVIEEVPHIVNVDVSTESSHPVTTSNRSQQAYSHEPCQSSHKTYLVPIGDMFDEQDVMKSISNILKEMFSGCWPTWTKVPNTDRELMWQRFQGLYEWDSKFDAKARHNWDFMNGQRYRDLMRGARDVAKGKYKAATGLNVDNDLSVLKPYFPEWIDEDNWATIIDTVWNTGKWKNVSVVNKRNRGVSGGGETATHSGGSRSMLHTQLKMEKEKGSPVSFIEVYDYYYTKKGKKSEQPLQFTSQRAANVRGEYKKLALEKSTSIPMNFDGTLWGKACGGKKKGKLFGATKAIQYLSSSRMSGASSSTSHVARDEEVQKLKDQLFESQERERVREADLIRVQEQVAILTKSWIEKFPPSPPN